MEYPPWKAVYSFYKRPKDKEIWGKMMRDLVEKSRISMGRNPNPSYSLIDSQSVKTTSKAEDRGIDGEKKIKGRKRHSCNRYTKWPLLHVKVHGANTHDTVASCIVFEEAAGKYPTLKGVCADAGYRKTMEVFVKDEMKRTIEISARITQG